MPKDRVYNRSCQKFRAKAMTSGNETRADAALMATADLPLLTFPGAKLIHRLLMATGMALLFLITIRIFAVTIKVLNVIAF